MPKDRLKTKEPKSGTRPDLTGFGGFKPSAQPNQSLVDGIATLQALATVGHPIGGRELARRLDLEPTKVNRLLKTLASLGIAWQTPDRKYTSGPGMHVLAAQSLFASGLVRDAAPALELLRRFGLLVAMGVLWRDSVTYLYHAPPGVPSSEALGRIGLYPATAGGIGLALLATRSNGQIRQLYEEGEIPGFPDGLTPLMDELGRIRENGYAYVLTRPEEDHHTLAITLGNPAHAAIGLSGKIREDDVRELVEALRSSAKLIALGSPKAGDDEEVPITVGRGRV